MRLTFELYGEWDKTIRTVQKVGPAVKIAGLYAQMKVASILKKKVIGHLLNQDLGWRALDDKYLAQKAKAGADTSILMAWNQYYQSIEMWHKSNEHTVFVGVKKGKYTYSVWDNRRSRIDIATIAFIHEFSRGSKIPRRPLWNPTIAEMGGEKGIKDLYVKHLMGKLRVMGIPVKQFKTLWH
jgi:hypothetical protein